MAPRGGHAPAAPAARRTPPRLPEETSHMAEGSTT